MGDADMVDIREFLWQFNVKRKRFFVSRWISLTGHGIWVFAFIIIDIEIVDDFCGNKYICIWIRIFV